MYKLKDKDMYLTSSDNRISLKNDVNTFLKEKILCLKIKNMGTIDDKIYKIVKDYKPKIKVEIDDKKESSVF